MGYLRLLIAIIAQAIEDARHPVVYDSEPRYRERLQEVLRQEATDWLLNSELVDIACTTWNLSREDLIRKIGDYAKKYNISGT